MIAQGQPEIVYPESDGKPMAENTLQWEWIVKIKFGLEAVFRDDENVFIASDLLWYPVEGEPGICAAPDAMVAFGRPKGYRGSYLQWKEEHIAPQVVFEILSPSNTDREMDQKLDFYETHGVQEYYEFDPDSHRLRGWMRRGEVFRRIIGIQDGWTSPLLKVHFIVKDDLILTGRNGEPFRWMSEVQDEIEEKRQLTTTLLAEAKINHDRLLETQQAAIGERERADAESRRAENERLRAETERERAEAAIRDKEAERLRAEQMSQELERLRELLRSRGSDPTP